MATEIPDEIIESLILKEQDRRKRINSMRPHSSYEKKDCWSEYVRDYPNPLLIMMQDGTHNIVVPELRFAQKWAYFFNPAGEYDFKDLNQIARTTKFGEKVADIISLDLNDFVVLLSAEQEVYQKSFADKSDIEKVLGSRNNFYFNNMMSKLNDDLTVANLAKNISEANKHFEYERTQYFIFENALEVDNFMFDKDWHTKKTKIPLVGLVSNKPINMSHARALFCEIINQTDAVIQELRIDWDQNRARIYQVPMSDFKTAEMLATVEPRYELNIGLVKKGQ